MNSPADLKDFFISYTGTDVDRAIWIAEQLGLQGIQKWWQIAPGFQAGEECHPPLTHTHLLISIQADQDIPIP